MTTQLPGYTGYLPAYERQYVARAPLAAHKYDDFEKRVPSMMSTSNYQTVYETTVAAKENNHYKPTSSSSSKLQNDSSAMSASLSYELPPQDTIAETFGRPSTQPPSTEKQPGKNDWSTTYGGSFDAWKTVDQTQKWQKIELDTTDPTVITNPNLKDISDNPFSRNRVLRNVEMKSNYQVDFGERGFNPLTRFDTSTGVQNIKLNATTQGMLLFAKI